MSGLLGEVWQGVCHIALKSCVRGCRGLSAAAGSRIDRILANALPNYDCLQGISLLLVKIEAVAAVAE